ncbi:MAG: glutaredoxin family protein [Gemmataceae bacterium]
MYTRKGCHLCDSAWEILTRAQNDYGFLLEARDVDSDPLLAEQFGQVVPVVLVSGKIRFRGRINEVLLKRLLKAEYAKSNGRE